MGRQSSHSRRSVQSTTIPRGGKGRHRFSLKRTSKGTRHPKILFDESDFAPLRDAEMAEILKGRWRHYRLLIDESGKVAIHLLAVMEQVAIHIAALLYLLEFLARHTR